MRDDLHNHINRLPAKAFKYVAVGLRGVIVASMALFAALYLYAQAARSIYEWGLSPERELAFAELKDLTLRIALLKPEIHKIIAINTQTGHRAKVSANHDIFSHYRANLYLRGDGQVVVTNSYGSTVLDPVTLRHESSSGRLCANKSMECIGYHASRYFSDFYYVGGWDFLDPIGNSGHSSFSWRFLAADKLLEDVPNQGG